MGDLITQEYLIKVNLPMDAVHETEKSILFDKFTKSIESWEATISNNIIKKWQKFLEENKNSEIRLQENPQQIVLNEKMMDQEIMANDKKSNESCEIQINNKPITMPNGKVNQPYGFEFDINKIDIPDISDFWFEGLESVGLSYNLEKCMIVGSPIIAGTHTIKLFIKRKDWEHGKPIYNRNLTLIINHDPKTLWLNKLSDKNDPYWKPDSECSFNIAGYSDETGIGKRMVAASQRGRSHAHEGIFRDDDFGFSFNDNNWYVLAVADGAGSAKASRKGSEIACKSVIDVCKLKLEEQGLEFETLVTEFNTDKSDDNRKKVGDAIYGIIGAAVFNAYKRIGEESQNSNRPVKDYATTLIVSISKKFDFGWFVGAFWVGDGGIGIYNKDTQFLKILGESDGGEFAGQTRFLTMPEITQPAELYRRLRFDIVDDFTALILMTDGVTDPKFETDSNLLKIEKWNELWNNLSKEVDFSLNNNLAAEHLLKWLDFWSPGNHDDRTIGIIY